MGRYGLRSGYIEVQNLRAGTVALSGTETSATKSVSFDDAMENVPAVVLTNNADTDVWVNTRSETGFTLERASTGSAETVSWMAMDNAHV